MTKHESIVLSAYTGVLMCDFLDMHKYIEQIMGRSVFDYELGKEDVCDEIRRLTKPDYCKIINNIENESK